MTGLMAVVLFAFGGLVLDLGHLYIAKSELQNASDAAALAGAKELNNKLSGVTAAVNRAIATAAQHRYDFKKPVNITIANIRFATCPNPGNLNTWGRPSNRSPTCTFIPAANVTSDAMASGLSFVEVDTGTQSLNTYLMRVAGAAYNSTQTAGYSVAGRYQTTVTPIGVCAVDPGPPKTKTYFHNPNLSELVELGFRRGVTYNIFHLNPLASGPSDPYLINPVDAYPNTCDPNHSSANFTAPFICTGSSAVISSGSGKVYTNTGMTASLAASLNSRFGLYGGPSVCEASSAPPDINVMPYPCTASTFPGCEKPKNPLKWNPIDWMNPAGGSNPNREFVDIELDDAMPYPKKPKYWPHPRPLAYQNYGPLWSYTRPVHPDGSTPPKPGAPFELSEIANSDIYDVAPRPAYFNGNYPNSVGSGFPANTKPAPYNQRSNSKYFDERTDGVRDRRVLNIVILDCTVPPVGPNSCAAMEVVGIGKFFMQVPADFTSGPNRQLDVEFAGLVDDVLLSEIRLYR